MPVCDLCNAATDLDPSRVFSPAEFRALVTNGLEPGDDIFALSAMMGMSKSQALASWRAQSLASTTNWLLCPACAARARTCQTKAASPTKLARTYQTQAASSTKPAAGQTKAGGGCFIATACYGCPDAPEVMALRRFRDNALIKSALGRQFIQTYYTHSPPIARFLSTHPRIARLVRGILLTPVTELLRKLP